MTEVALINESVERDRVVVSGPITASRLKRLVATLARRRGSTPTLTVSGTWEGDAIVGGAMRPARVCFSRGNEAPVLHLGACATIGEDAPVDVLLERGADVVVELSWRSN